MKFRHVLAIPIVAGVCLAAYGSMFGHIPAPTPLSADPAAAETTAPAPTTATTTNAASDQKADIPVSAMPGATFYTVQHTPACTSEDNLKVLLAVLRAGDMEAARQTTGCFALPAGTRVVYIDKDGWMLPWFRASVTLDEIGNVTLWLRAADLRTDLEGAQSGQPLSY